MTETEVSNRLLIDKERMLDWGGWNQQAEEYLQSIEGEINVYKEAQEYQDKIIWFSRWVYGLVRSEVDVELKSWRELSTLTGGHAFNGP